MPNSQRLKANHRTQICKWYKKNYSFLSLYKKINFNNQMKKKVKHTVCIELIFKKRDFWYFEKIHVYFVRASLWVPCWTNIRLTKVTLVASTLTYLPSLEVASSKFCDLYWVIRSQYGSHCLLKQRCCVVPIPPSAHVNFLVLGLVIGLLQFRAL